MNWRAWLEHPRWPLVVALLGVLLTLPALWLGFIADDFYQIATLDGIGDLAGTDPLLDLFGFLPDRGDINGQYIARGILPWWADLHVRVSFLRPVTALTHILDHTLWPGSPWLMHLHSLLWYGLGTLLVALLLRSVRPGPAAGLGALLFVVASSHAMPVGWIANRNALICLVFGVLGVSLHVRWRRGGGWVAMVGATLSFAVGLGAGEATLGMLGYVLAWQLTMDRRRLAPLIPSVALVATWRWIYQSMGYGAENSWLYVDPGRQPLAFAGALFERWPVLAGGLGFLPMTDPWVLLPRAGQLAMSAAGLLAVIALLALCLPLLRRSRVARFWALGAAFALIPPCATFPADRVLLHAGVGASALIAMRLLEPARGLARLARGALFFWVLPLSAPLLPLRVATLLSLNDIFRSAADSAPAEPEVVEQTLVFLNGSELVTAYVGIIRELEGRLPVPRRVALLAPMTGDLTVGRLDAFTLEITADEGWFSHTLDRLFSSPSQTWAVGDVRELPDLSVEIVETTVDGRPRRVRFRFHSVIEQSGCRLLAWVDGSLREVHLAEQTELRLPATLP